jgi:HK97 family phage prohead protease
MEIKNKSLPEPLKRWLRSLPDNAEPRRYKTTLKCEKRDGGPPKISGYAAVFNSDSEDLGFIEEIKPGAFKDTIARSDVRALFNHEPSLIFGRQGVNLRLKEDKTGLYMETDPVATSTYRMVSENIEAGLINQQSFAFTVPEGGDKWNDDYSRRTIYKIDQIFDVSPVTYPAYSDTSVALRSRDAAKGSPTTAGNPSYEGPTTLDKELFDKIEKLKRKIEL